MALSAVSQLDASIRSMRALAGGTGVVLSTEALLARSADGTWRDISPGGLSTALIDAVEFRDARHGWVLAATPALDGTAPQLRVLRTEDGGATWAASDALLRDADADEYGGQATFSFADSSHGWLLLRLASSSAFSFARLFSTADGGATWHELSAPPAFGRMRFRTPGDGWLAGGSGMEALWHTTDGGATWRRVTVAAGDGERLAFVDAPVFQNPAHGTVAAWARSETDTALVTFESDGGESWRPSGRTHARAAVLARSGGGTVALGTDSSEERRPGIIALSPGRPLAMESGAELDFPSADAGWLLTTHLACDRTAGQCTLRQSLFASVDGRMTEITPAAESSLRVVPLGTHYSYGDGFDKRDYISASDMQSLYGSYFSFTYSWVYNGATYYQDYAGTYSEVGAYIGGRNFGGAPVNNSWMQQVTTQGWGILPLWVPSQAPCSTRNYWLISGDPVALGQSEGANAAAAASSDGLPSGSVIWVDIEQFDTTNSTCGATTKRFVNAFFGQLHAYGYAAGLYTSASNGAFWLQTDANLTSPPDDLWLARWGATRFNWSPWVSNSTYSGSRAHQYASINPSGWPFYGSNVDYDAVDGPVDGVGGGGGGTCYTLNAYSSPGGWTAVNTGYNCNNVGYTTGTQVSVTANPYSGYQFSYWTSSNCTLADPNAQTTTCTISGTGTASVTSNYITAPQCWVLSAFGNPNNAGYPAVNTQANCNNYSGYTTGTAISVTAVPYNNGYQFSNWTASNCSLANAYAQTTTCTVTGSGNPTITANFNAVPPSCTSYSLSPPSADPTADAGAVGVTVTGAPAGCQGTWSASGNGSWITVSPTAGNNSGTVTVSWTQNPWTSMRSDSATIAGVSFPVRQAGAAAGIKFVHGDYNGDRRTDAAVFRPSTGWWYVATGQSLGWGGNGDIPAPADYDGDGKTDFAVFRPSTGTWYIVQSRDGSTRIVQFGQNGDKPVPGDYDGDNRSDIAVYRPSTGVWYMLLSTNGTTRSVQLGGATRDVPAQADYDGDGKDDPAVENQATGLWRILLSTTNAERDVQWGGTGGDLPAPADYDGDGKADICMESQLDGKWYMILSSTGATRIVQWGGSGGDQPQPGDYDGDGKADICVFNEGAGMWYIIRSSDGGTTLVSLGQSGDIGASR